MFNFIVAATLKDIECSYNIAFNVNFWILYGIADTSLRSKMNDSMRIALPENLVNFFFVFQVDFMEGEPVKLQKNFKAVIFEIDVVIIVDVI